MKTILLNSVIKSKVFLVFALLIFYSNKTFAQIGNGKDGSPVIYGTINSYTYLMTDAFKCDNKLIVNDASAFETKDLVLIIQMQGAQITDKNDSTYGAVEQLNQAGGFEYAFIEKKIGDTLFLNFALLNNYSRSGHTQVVKVPQYISPVISGTITCKQWDGKTGGIVAMDVTDTLTFNASISVIGKGFRGGITEKGNHIMDIRFEYFAETDPTYYSLKGEGIAGYGVEPFIAGRGAPANGGGGGNIHTTGGGGGANYGCGGNGGWGYPVDPTDNEKIIFGIGGYALDYSTNDKIFAGGGGGSGHEHFGNGTSGANGGGLVMITCNNIIGNGHNILASGAGSASSGGFGDGAGGAGAGGSIFISANNIYSTLNLLVNGGNGGSTILPGFGPGGGGGGGVVKLSKPSLLSAFTTINLNGGMYGVAAGDYYGGSAGCIGGIITNAVVPVNISEPKVFADFNITVNDNGQSDITNSSSGASSFLWNFGDGNSSTVFEPSHTFSPAGAFDVMLIASNNLCSDTAVKKVRRAIPNVFTPNNDGTNDEFSLVDFVDAGDEISFTIIDRWGHNIITVNNATLSWNGKSKNGGDVPQGTYFYILKITHRDKNQTEEFKGTVMLLR